MSLLPANVGTGYVTGVFVNSDGQAETGKVWLRPRFTSAKITTAEPPTTVLPTPRSVQIGEDGQLVETEVVATSDPDLGLEAWTYEVSFKFDSGVSYGPFDIAVPEGETVDLTLVAPAATVEGVQIVRGFGVPDTATAQDGDVVTYDQEAGQTAWWSRAEAVGGALRDEFADPESPMHDSISDAVERVIDELAQLPITVANIEPGVDGAAALQAQLSALSGPAVVEIPASATAYLLADDVTVPAGVTIRGKGATIKMADGTDADGFAALLRPESGATIEGLTIDLNKANTGAPAANTRGNGIYTAGPAWGAAITVRDVTVTNGHEAGIRFVVTGQPNDPDAMSGSPVVVEHCTVTGCDYGLRLTNVVGGAVVGGDYHDNDSGGVHVQHCADVTLIGARANHSASGHGIVVLYGSRVAMVGCHASGNGMGGITLGGGSTTIPPFESCAITGCTTDNNSYSGISLDPTVSGQNGVPQYSGCTLTGNISRGNGIHGINLTCAADVTITGNTCHDNTSQGIGIASAGAVVTGNSCRGNGAYGLALFGPHEGNYGRHSVGVNNLGGNTSGAFSSGASIASTRAVTETF